MYTVRNWDTGEVLFSTTKLALARRECRGQGHTGELVNGRYVPVAYVADEGGGCIFNPRFGHAVSSAVGSIINRYDANFDSRTA